MQLYNNVVWIGLDIISTLAGINCYYFIWCFSFFIVKLSSNVILKLKIKIKASHSQTHLKPQKQLELITKSSLDTLCQLRVNQHQHLTIVLDNYLKVLFLYPNTEILCRMTCEKPKVLENATLAKVGLVHKVFRLGSARSHLQPSSNSSILRLPYHYSFSMVDILSAANGCICVYFTLTTPWNESNWPLRAGLKLLVSALKLLRALFWAGNGPQA